ncbi:MAG: hypothetical protein JW892_14810 [Anaerolineae bacterium]|nr:hypothetical protein [Anaerolineae bacterium]
MRPGPDKVIECPHCRTPARVFTLFSGNTCGARTWTDGKTIALMLPQPPFITKCSGCNHYFWLSEAKVIGEIPVWEPEMWLNPRTWRRIPGKWRAAKHVRELSEMESLEAIGVPVAHNIEQEVHLRVRAWWASNDPMRSRDQCEGAQIQTASPRSLEATMNLEHLLELLDESDPYERIVKAEVLRELGRFDDAIGLLDFNFPSEYAGVAALIRGFAKKKDPVVREILK